MMDFYTQPLSLPLKKYLSYGTAGTGKHQKTLGFIFFLVNCYQCNALPARYKAFFLACSAICGYRICQGNGYHVTNRLGSLHVSINHFMVFWACYLINCMVLIFVPCLTVRANTPLGNAGKAISSGNCDPVN
jgi:hypothetical protein